MPKIDDERVPKKGKPASKAAKPVKKIDQVKAKIAKAVIATHKVEGNQTLSHIAEKYYGNTTRPYWELIHKFNKDVIGDDEKNIYAGLELKIPALPDELKD